MSQPRDPDICPARGGVRRGRVRSRLCPQWWNAPGRLCRASRGAADSARVAAAMIAPLLRRPPSFAPGERARRDGRWTMAAPIVHSLLPIAGTAAAGFLGGVAAWFATNFWGRPLARFYELRQQTQE